MASVTRCAPRIMLSIIRTTANLTSDLTVGRLFTILNSRKKSLELRFMDERTVAQLGESRIRFLRECPSTSHPAAASRCRGPECLSEQ